MDVLNNADFSFGNSAWLKRKKKPKYHGSVSLNIVDLFCGCGGFTLGAVEAACANGVIPNIALAIDIDRDAINVYKHNFENAKAITCDICSMFPGKLRESFSNSENQLRDETGKIELLLAGPPCQGHSNLNNKTRRNDPRNLLYLKAIRAIEVLQPEVAIIENVTAVKHDRQKVLNKSLDFLKKLGYLIETKELDAINFNVAQRRKRHFLIAYKSLMPYSFKQFLSELNRSKMVLKDVIKDLSDESKNRTEIFYTPSLSSPDNQNRIKYLFENGLYDLPNEQRPGCHRNKSHSYISMYGRLNWDVPAQTITSGFGSMGQGRYVHPSRQRVITPHEAVRIQGFPDYFDFGSIIYRGSLQKMIANAVPPPISATIVSYFFQRLKN